MGAADRKQRDRHGPTEQRPDPGRTETGRRSGTRHVWIRASTFHAAPLQGLVVAWQQRTDGWAALCVWVERGPDGADQLVQRWLAASRLAPVRTDPTTSPWEVNPRGTNRPGDDPPRLE